jgi:PAS domain S-box-containing protein
MIRPDGEVRVVQSKAGCELDEQGEVVALIGLFQDVTDQVRNLENLTASEARYRLLAENTSDVIVRCALDGTLLYVSPACRAMGYEPEDLIGTPADRLIHPDDRERFLANCAKLYAGETPDPSANRQHRYRTATGAGSGSRAIPSSSATPRAGDRDRQRLSGTSPSGGSCRNAPSAWRA